MSIARELHSAGAEAGMTRSELEAMVRAKLSPELAAMVLRPWTPEDEARYRAGLPEMYMQLDMHAAWVVARKRDPEITWEDECTPFDPAWSADSIADWKRMRARYSAA